MPTASVLSIIVGVSGFIGLLSLLAYLTFIFKVRQLERSVRQTIEGEGLFNANQIIRILEQFKDDHAARLAAIRELARVDTGKAEALLLKVKDNVDIGQLAKLSNSRFRVAAGILAIVFLALAVLGFLYSKRDEKTPDVPKPIVEVIDSPSLVSPLDAALLRNIPRTTKLVWKPTNRAASYLVEIQYMKSADGAWYDLPDRARVPVEITEYSFVSPGPQTGRWRVTAVAMDGKKSAPSEWWHFKHEGYGTGAYAGRWRINFHFLGTAKDPAKDWFSWIGELTQVGNDIEGPLTSGTFVGKLKGKVSDNVLEGKVKFFGDQEPWWPEFRLTLSSDQQAASGSARFEYTDDRGTHSYRVKAERITD